LDDDPPQDAKTEGYVVKLVGEIPVGAGAGVGPVVGAAQLKVPVGFVVEMSGYAAVAHRTIVGGELHSWYMASG